ncbi:MAG: IS200/IS605 family transposase [Anaerolineales bacterium]
MVAYRKGPHAVYDIKYHLVWVTKYRYKVLKGDLALRMRDLIRNICEQHGMRIIKGHVSKDHVHLFVSAPPQLSVSEVMQYVKRKSSRRLQEEYPSLRKRYWGWHLWARGYFCATTGTVTDEMIEAYLEKHASEAEDNFTVADGE